MLVQLDGGKMHILTMMWLISLASRGKWLIMKKRLGTQALWDTLKHVTFCILYDTITTTMVQTNKSVYPDKQSEVGQPCCGPGLTSKANTLNNGKELPSP